MPKSRKYKSYRNGSRIILEYKNLPMYLPLVLTLSFIPLRNQFCKRREIARRVPYETWRSAQTQFVSYLRLIGDYIFGKLKAPSSHEMTGAEIRTTPRNVVADNLNVTLFWKQLQTKNKPAMESGPEVTQQRITLYSKHPWRVSLQQTWVERKREYESRHL